MSDEVVSRIVPYMDALPTTDVGGVGGTLSGNALSLAAMRATIEHVWRDESFERMIALGERWTGGVKAGIEARGLPWEVQRLGCRAEYWFWARRPRAGG